MNLVLDPSSPRKQIGLEHWVVLLEELEAFHGFEDDLLPVTDQQAGAAQLIGKMSAELAYESVHQCFDLVVIHGVNAGQHMVDVGLGVLPFDCFSDDVEDLPQAAVGAHSRVGVYVLKG